MTTPPTGTTRLPLDDPRRQRRPALAVPTEPIPPAEDDEFFVDGDAYKLLREDYGMPAGHWLKVRQEIDWGQETQLQMAPFSNVPADAMTGDGIDVSKVTVDLQALATAKLRLWILEWSLTHKGQQVPITDQSLRGLKPRIARVINQAVDKHIAEVREGNGPQPDASSGD